MVGEEEGEGRGGNERVLLRVLKRRRWGEKSGNGGGSSSSSSCGNNYNSKVTSDCSSSKSSCLSNGNQKQLRHSSPLPRSLQLFLLVIVTMTMIIISTLIPPACCYDLGGGGIDEMSRISKIISGFVDDDGGEGVGVGMDIDGEDVVREKRSSSGVDTNNADDDVVGRAHSHERSSSPQQQQATQQQHRLVNLKHRRYKSLRDNVTTASSHQSSSSQERISSSPTILHPDLHDHLHIHPHPHHHHHHPLPNIKSSRGGGFDLQKSPPDLQFGLAFTVPFISLSTEKLIHGVAAGKGWGDSVSSLFKLNFSGLFLAALVGVVAIAGLFLPTLLGAGGLGGFGNGGGWGGWGGGGGGGNGILDGLIPNQFTDALYNDYNGEGGLGGGWGGNNNKGAWGKDLLGGGSGPGGRRNGRKGATSTPLDFMSAVGLGVMKLAERVKKSVGAVENCAVERVCGEVRDGGSGPLSSLILEFKDSDVFKEKSAVLSGDGPSGILGKGLRKLYGIVVDGEVGVCDSSNQGDNKGKKKGEKGSADPCEGLSNITEIVKDVIKSWGVGGGGGHGDGNNSINNGNKSSSGEAPATAKVK